MWCTGAACSWCPSLPKSFSGKREHRHSQQKEINWIQSSAPWNHSALLTLSTLLSCPLISEAPPELGIWLLCKGWLQTAGTCRHGIATAPTHSFGLQAQPAQPAQLPSVEISFCCTRRRRPFGGLPAFGDRGNTPVKPRGAF